jgi:hypothetical protein
VARGRLFHLVVAAREAVFSGFDSSFHQIEHVVCGRVS